MFEICFFKPLFFVLKTLSTWQFDNTFAHLPPNNISIDVLIFRGAFKTFMSWSLVAINTDAQLDYQLQIK